MEKHYENDEIEIDLKELFFELLGEWKKILFSAVLAAVILFIVSSFIITPEYRSTSKLYVLSKSTSITSLTDIQMGTNLTNDYMEVVGGRPVLDQVIANLGLDMSYKGLSSILEFDNPSNSRILVITATHEDPEVAKAIVDEMADVTAAFIAEKMDQDPPSVIQYGYVESNPVSPNVMKNTMFGGVIGAFLAIAIVVVSYLMNDTIMTPDDMERKVGVKVLASLPYNVEEDDGDGRPSDSKKQPKPLSKALPKDKKLKVKNLD